MSVFVVLLRAIGPITHKIMSMQSWREGVAAAGFVDPETYLATGNMIVSGSGDGPTVQTRMTEIVRSLGLGAGNAAVVRTPEQLARLVAANPLPEAALARPQQMGVYFFESPHPDFGWVAEFAGRETLKVSDGHLLVDYQGPISESGRLGPMIERRTGVATARNWNTLCGLAARAGARQAKEL